MANKTVTAHVRPIGQQTVPVEISLVPCFRTKDYDGNPMTVELGQPMPGWRMAIGMKHYLVVS